MRVGVRVFVIVGVRVRVGVRVEVRVCVGLGVLDGGIEGVKVSLTVRVPVTEGVLVLVFVGFLGVGVWVGIAACI